LRLNEMKGALVKQDMIKSAPPATTALLGLLDQFETGLSLECGDLSPLWPSAA
jgi:hypothetical protein